MVFSTLYILTLLIGSLIGYIINSLEIRVFCPHTAKYMHRMHVPFLLDISKIDVDETEKLILQVMKKRLRAIVWFGAGSEFIMGWGNVFRNWLRLLLTH